jgi:hypothetical protein
VTESRRVSVWAELRRSWPPPSWEYRHVQPRGPILLGHDAGAVGTVDIWSPLRTTRSDAPSANTTFSRSVTVVLVGRIGVRHRAVGTQNVGLARCEDAEPPYGLAGLPAKEWIRDGRRLVIDTGIERCDGVGPFVRAAADADPDRNASDEAGGDSCAYALVRKGQNAWAVPGSAHLEEAS